MTPQHPFGKKYKTPLQSNEGNSMPLQNWQKMLKRMKLDDIKAKAPGFFEASGGYTMFVSSYSDKSTNHLTKAILDFLTFKGHYSNRINTQGQARVHKIPRYNIFNQQMQTVGKNVQWTKSSTRRGTPDIDAIIFAQPVKIEVKVGRDCMSDDQEREQTSIEKSGGLYFVAKDFPSFLEWYEENFESTVTA